MTAQFKYIIIGRGMMGSAAAKYLAWHSEGVAVIGPSEPADPASHAGVFASHYDEARITRTIDQSPVWALLANRSIARYDAIASESGIDFYVEAGCLVVGPKRGGSDPYVERVWDAAQTLGVAATLLDASTLATRFPYFRFGHACEGVHEASNAGYVNPRRLVEAQSRLAEKAGATLISETVVSVREEGSLVVVSTDSGASYTAEKVLVAAGGFSIAERLLPRRLDLSVYARTVAFFEITPERSDLFEGMPSLIHQPDDPSEHIYLLPPVRYPDGKVYLKIGGDPDDLRLSNEPDVRVWFRSGGRVGTRDHLKRIIDRLVPDLAHVPPTMAACVTSFTPSGYPAVDFASERIGVLTGGCGAAAKSSDEIGRLGAGLLLEGRSGGDYGVEFNATFV
ncbi:FAD-dependent oxidoreductase [Ciceribacter sp. L1K23]|uniref:NAD(P)/FAD-dependent oxidoreductase n=1 Tax=Ciceribacter sp. L1K23 TaxID=2820276 RepID=UPI001B826A4D|nr:FAD-dependent oxidoreductase [Ciceribacter sp. L1K23]MBR0555076.1 FAD-dependent oxidoreductase [Ciceribacter sp. L1K23]